MSDGNNVVKTGGKYDGSSKEKLEQASQTLQYTFIPLTYNTNSPASALVRIMLFATNDNVCTYGVKNERKRVKDFIMQETLDKTVTYM